MRSITQLNIQQLTGRNAFWLLVVFLACLALMLPILLVGIPDGYDLGQHLRFADSFYRSITAGDLLPRWADADNFGFGSVGIRFYPPFAYYVLAVTQFFLNDWYLSYAVNTVIWMYVGCIGVFFWCREWLSIRNSGLAAILYAAAPYHTAQIYQAGLFAEFAAAGILPFCFLYATRIVRQRDISNTVLFSIAFSLLVLTHIPTSLIGSIALAIYIIVLIDRPDWPRVLADLAAAGALAIGATAFHISKLVTETAWVMHNSPQYYSSGYYDYKKYLFPMFYSSSGNYAQKLLLLLDAQTVLTFLLIIPILAVFIYRIRHRNGRRNRIELALFVTSIFSMFIMSVPSSWIWEYVPLLQRIQFPWRWLAVLSLVGTAVFVTGLVEAYSRFGHYKRVFVYGVIILTASFIVFDLSQNILASGPLGRDKFDEKMVKIANEEGCDCWWPVWAKRTAFTARQKVVAGERNVEIVRWQPEDREIRISAGDAEAVRVATFYYPYWKAEVNGTQALVQSDPDGAILIAVPEGAADVRLYFVEPFLTAASRYISLSVWIALIIGLACIQIFRAPKTDRLELR